MERGASSISIDTIHTIQNDCMRLLVSIASAPHGDDAAARRVLGLHQMYTFGSRYYLAQTPPCAVSRAHPKHS